MAVGGGALIIAGIGFAGSYSAVVDLAREKGFGKFAHVFPIGVDAGIAVLLALDLLLSWIRIPFPILRHIAWMLTAATIAFNGAAAWPDPIGVGMHSVMPVLFVVVVEAVRHAVGRLADITADKHMDGVRITRWLLSPVPTAKLWRRMKLWELRSYEQVVGMEQDRLIYQARLQARYGRAWRRKAPVEAVLPLRLARIGVPLADTAPAGLAAAGLDIEWRPTARPPAETTALPAFEEHTTAALEVLGHPVQTYADTPSALPALPSGPEEGNHPSLRAALTGRQPAYAEEGAPKKAREEVTARIPQVDLPEEAPECEDVVQVPAQVPPPEVGTDARTGESADESTNPKVAPGGNRTSDQRDPLAEHRARVAEETAVKRQVIREKWTAAKAENPALSKAAFARMTSWTDREVYAALQGASA
ncbi:DUF2637 domain-containing protein [Streptomyces sp. AP-93]|uniref:DUF2637 domain-containing protein n=1 Tax=Streptomyces sp. AP-93 TaxID=2929048 RepID=UPI001FAEC456|nr:DUF2637 domain-containing protein [Streptomyces sp. AP-93]MCJ0868066.1 DUF2637 domain-containing protein [Streptomyces sp. AP-93]